MQTTELFPIGERVVRREKRRNKAGTMEVVTRHGTVELSVGDSRQVRWEGAGWPVSWIDKKLLAKDYGIVKEAQEEPDSRGNAAVSVASTHVRIKGPEGAG